MNKQVARKSLMPCVILAALTFLTSCDCLQHVQGVVLDAETQLPIHSVMVIDDNLTDSLSTTNLIIYTDSIGEFDFTSMAVDLFGCPKISLSFKKEGYEMLI